MRQSVANDLNKPPVSGKGEKMKQHLLQVGLIALLCLPLFMGCSNSWVPQRKPETPEERKAVMEHETKILSNIPKTLAGHDQDWDDAIATAHRVAVETQCKTRLYEHDPGWKNGYTGRMKEIH